MSCRSQCVRFNFPYCFNEIPLRHIIISQGIMNKEINFDSTTYATAAAPPPEVFNRVTSQLQCMFSRVIFFYSIFFLLLVCLFQSSAITTAAAADVAATFPFSPFVNIEKHVFFVQFWTYLLFAESSSIIRSLLYHFLLQWSLSQYTLVHSDYLSIRSIRKLFCENSASAYRTHMPSSKRRLSTKSQFFLPALVRFLFSFLLCILIYCLFIPFIMNKSYNYMRADGSVSISFFVSRFLIILIAKWMTNHTLFIRFHFIPNFLPKTTNAPFKWWQSVVKWI